MKRMAIVNQIIEYGVVAVIRGDSKDQAIKTVEAVKAGGIKVMEVTMTVPGAVDIIKELCELNKNHEIIIGAGTVLDAETARACILAGAEFIVSPYMNLDVVRMCNRYRIAVMPAATTVRDAIEGLEAGAEIIKIFPAGLFGPSIISNFKGPLPQGNYMPTGGVTVDNLKDWIKAGAVAVGIGSDLSKGAKTGDYDLVKRTAEQFVSELKKARAEGKK